MNKYTLRSGETIDISCLQDTDREHISRIEKLIADRADYHEVYRGAFAPLKEGRGFTAKSLLELHDTPRYKVVLDMVTRYWERLFSWRATTPSHILRTEPDEGLALNRHYTMHCTCKKHIIW